MREGVRVREKKTKKRGDFGLSTASATAPPPPPASRFGGLDGQQAAKLEVLNHGELLQTLEREEKRREKRRRERREGEREKRR